MAEQLLNPMVSFYFVVSFAGDTHEIIFQEVSGIDSNIELETVSDDGENRFTSGLPNSVKSPTLVLKRGVAFNDSPLVHWCRESLESNLDKPLKPREVIVKLLDGKGALMRSWALSNAWPVKWSVGNFDPTKNEQDIEIMELAYSELTQHD